MEAHLQTDYSQLYQTQGPWNHIGQSSDSFSTSPYLAAPWNGQQYWATGSSLDMAYSSSSSVIDSAGMSCPSMSRSASSSSSYTGADMARMDSQLSFGSEHTRIDAFEVPASLYPSVPSSQGCMSVAGTPSLSPASGKALLTRMPTSTALGTASRKRSQFFCQYCNERPKGFRGEHELIRHQKLRHEPTRSMWICVAPADMPKFLDNCKHCKSHKAYGAYYNAAQHIRRCHFAPTKRGRKSKSESSNSASVVRLREKNWPPMSEMKRYLKEIIVNDSNVKQETPDAQHSAEELVEDEEENNDPIDASPETMMQQYSSSFGYYPDAEMGAWVATGDGLASSALLLQGLDADAVNSVTPNYDPQLFHVLGL